MVDERSAEELIGITDELMAALPFGVKSLAPEDEQHLADIAGDLSREEWRQLY